MKYFFKSDYFEYVHPTNSPRQYKDFTKEDLEIAKENTSKFKYNKELFDKALKNSDGKMPTKQYGSILIFPEVPTEQRKILKSFIKDTFKNVNDVLISEFNEKDDNTVNWEICDDGSHFSGETLNYKTKDKFNSNSISIYIAGCKDTTADYLIEEAIDTMYLESERHDKKKVNFNNKIGFGNFKSFLIYSMEKNKFYEFATHEDEVYHKPTRESKGYETISYSVDLPVSVNPLTEGFDFE